MVCEWLELKDVVVLDSALCNNKFRSDFLSLIGSPHSIFATLSCDSSFGARWVIKKNIKFRSVEIYSNLLHNDDKLSLELFKRLSGPALQDVTLTTFRTKCQEDLAEDELNTIVEDVMAILADFCPNLASFHICSDINITEIGGQFISTLFAWCTKIRSVQFTNCICNYDELFRALYSAPCLERIEISGGTAMESVLDIPLNLVNPNVTHLRCVDFRTLMEASPLIGDICAHFPKLVYLVANDISNVNLVSISEHCKHLKEATLYVSELIDEEAAVQAARNWPHLRKLKMHDYDSFLDNEDEYDEANLAPTCTEGAMLLFIRSCPQLVFLNTVPKATAYEDLKAQEDVGAMDGAGYKLNGLCVDSLSAGAFKEITSLCKHISTLIIHHSYLYTVSAEMLTSLDSYVRPLESALHLIKGTGIKSLYLHNYKDLTGKNVRRLEGLEYIGIENASTKNIQCLDLLQLAERCPKLKVLTMRNSLEMSDNFVIPFLDRCPTLIALRIVNDQTEEEIMRPSLRNSLIKDFLRRLYPNVLHFCVDFGPDQLIS